MKISDPVCGMKIDSDTAHAVEAFEGRHDHFCSAQCRICSCATRSDATCSVRACYPADEPQHPPLPRS